MKVVTQTIKMINIKINRNKKTYIEIKDKGKHKSKHKSKGKGDKKGKIEIKE